MLQLLKSQEITSKNHDKNYCDFSQFDAILTKN